MFATQSGWILYNVFLLSTIVSFWYSKLVQNCVNAVFQFHFVILCFSVKTLECYFFNTVPILNLIGRFELTYWISWLLWLLLFMSLLLSLQSVPLFIYRGWFEWQCLCGWLSCKLIFQTNVKFFASKGQEMVVDPTFLSPM